MNIETVQSQIRGYSFFGVVQFCLCVLFILIVLLVTAECTMIGPNNEISIRFTCKLTDTAAGVVTLNVLACMSVEVCSNGKYFFLTKEQTFCFQSTFPFQNGLGEQKGKQAVTEVVSL